MDLGDVLVAERDLHGARPVREETVALCRRVNHDQFSPQKLAVSLSSYADLLAQQGDFSRARAAHGEALGIIESISRNGATPDRSAIAFGLASFGRTLDLQGEHRAAVVMFEKALAVYRELDETSTTQFRTEIASTLLAVGEAQHRAGDYVAARETLHAAFWASLRLTWRGQQRFNYTHAATLDRLVKILVQTGALELAVLWAAAAIGAAEYYEPQDRWLAKGQVGFAYEVWLGKQVEEQHSGGVFSCLAAIREGTVSARDDSAERVLEGSIEALRAVSSAVKTRVRIVVAQGVDPWGFALVGVLDETGWRYAKTDLYDAAMTASAPFSDQWHQPVRAHVLPVGEQPYAVQRRLLAEWGEQAWKALPDLVRETLHPKSDGVVLVSGDVFFAHFPWEALRFGEGDDDWLGLARTLTRHTPISAASLAKLRPVTHGNGSVSAAVVFSMGRCPKPRITGSTQRSRPR